MAEKRDSLTPTSEPVCPEYLGPEYKDNSEGVVVHDEVFGDLSEDAPRYRSVGWMGSAMLMLKTQIGLGVLGIPVAFDALGIVPGVICLCTVGVIVTWSNFIVGDFKRNHPECYSISDAARKMFGWWGDIFFSAAFVLWWMFVAGSGMLSISIALNAVSDHATCTAVYVIAAAASTYILGSIRTLERISWIAWVGVICIVTSLMVTTIGVGVQKHPASVPKDVEWVSDYKIVADKGTPFNVAINAVTTFVFAYAGTPAFFSIAAEMRDPREYNKALIACQGFVTAFYLVVGIVVYYFAGSHVSSPAPGTAGPVLKKVAYGFAIPALMASTLLFIHITGKYIFVRVLRGSRHLTANTVIHWSTWLGCTFVVALIAYIIASAIPVFGDLVSLIGAVFGTVMCFQPMGFMWLYDNWSKGKSEKSLRWILMVCWCVFVIVSGTFLMVGGTYGAVVSIIDDYRANGGTAAWSCADNSGSS